MELEQIWRDYNASLRGFLLTKVSNPADVDELLQDVMLKTMQSLGSLNHKEKLSPWLFQITRNVIVDHYRSKGITDNELPADELSNDSSLTHSQELSQCIDVFISALPEETADLLRQVDLEGKSQKALAAQLGISYSALKSRVQRGRRELRTLYDNCCHIETNRKGEIVDFAEKAKKCNRCS